MEHLEESTWLNMMVANWLKSTPVCLKRLDAPKQPTMVSKSVLCRARSSLRSPIAARAFLDIARQE